MRLALPILALAALLPIPGNAGDADKHLHAAAGVALYAIDSATTLIVTRAEPQRRHAVTLGRCVGLGLAKEALDEHQGGDADPYDAAATAAGCAAGMLAWSAGEAWIAPTVDADGAGVAVGVEW